ncbi:MAG: hypothetical protein K0Q92_2225 [Steroidobacteraceae bacterium]|jgi:hypothetical protein|nr:hypothetical protein [Steroidobacteraceae bacterium]
MMRSALLVLMAVLLVRASTAASDDSKTLEISEPRAMAERAMKYLEKEDLKGMFAFVGKLLLQSHEEFAKLRETTIEQRKAALGAFGGYRGYAFVNECRRSNALTRITFIEKRAKSFLRWQFYFYKPDSTWHLTSMVWDNKPLEMYEPCA